MCEGAEPIPYISRSAVRQALLDGPKLSRDVFINDQTTKTSTLSSLELMTLPVCLQFARTLGARSIAGRRLMAAERQSTQKFSVAVATGMSRRSRSVSEEPTFTAAASAAAADDRDDVFELNPSRRQTILASTRYSVNI